MERKIEGGCHCGAVRYAITEVRASMVCHCRTCQRVAGAPVLAWVSVAADDYRVTKGEPAGYAIYWVKQDWAGGSSKGVISILEAIAPTPEAARELWRWLLDFDWTSRFEADGLPLDHPLFLLLAEPRRMRFEVDDGVWSLYFGPVLLGRFHEDDLSPRRSARLRKYGVPPMDGCGNRFAITRSHPQAYYYYYY